MSDIGALLFRLVCLSVCLSVRLSVLKNSDSTGGSLLKFEVYVYFTKICLEKSSSIKIAHKNGNCLNADRYRFLIYLAQFCLEGKMFLAVLVEKSKNILYNRPFSKIVPFVS